MAPRRLEDRAPRRAGEVDLDEFDDGPVVGLVDLLTWLGDGKRVIAWIVLLATLAGLAVALLLPPVFTARTTLLPPTSQQQGSAASALAALGALGGLAGGLAPKTPDELYVALLKSDSVQRALDERYALRDRYEVKTYEELRRTLPQYVRVAAEKKTGLISIEVDDEDPKFAAELANGHVDAVTKVLDRLAVSEAQQRRVFFGKQLEATKEDLVRADQALRAVQEKSGMIVLDKQAEALIRAAAELRAQITEREVRLKVLRTGATEQNRDVIRLNSELRALRAELARMESASEGDGTPIGLPVGRIPAAAVDYIRAMREVKLQETLLQTMVRQYEAAKLDEAKEGSGLQQVDVALVPDYKSKPKRALIVLGALFAGLLLSGAWAVWRGYGRSRLELDPAAAQAWQSMRRAWRWRR